MGRVLQDQVSALIDHVRQVVVARPEAIKLAFLGLLCQGHVLLEDFPGVGKTLLAKALAQSLRVGFKRIQFTPDLLPTDITGSSIFHPAQGTFQFIPGAVFANVVLADEIDRGSPRTQSALLEAMGEGQVTFDGVTYPLPRPFFVIATRNRAELHGTFPLPHAQLDRFLLSFSIGYPNATQEVQILEMHEHEEPALTPLFTGEEVVALQEQVLQVEVARPVKEYIVRIVAETRSHPDLLLGASPRGAVLLQRAAQGWAAMERRAYVTPEDVKAVAPAVLLHRLVPRLPQATSQCVDDILDQVAVPL